MRTGYKTQSNWIAKNAKQISLKLLFSTDADIISRLESVNNVQGYIKRLIREDIKNNPEGN